MSQEKIPLSRMILVASLHLGVGVAIVAISSFVNAELKLSAWTSGTISIYLGIPVLFELSRLFFANLYDQKGIIRSSLVLGLGSSLAGLLFLPFYLKPIGNYGLVVLVALFYFGSSIMTTLVDANLTLKSHSDDRSRVAGVIQTLRLSGFAIGGIGGSILYSRMEFFDFILVISIFYLIVGLVSLLSIYPVRPKLKDPMNKTENKSLFGLISSGMPLLMTIFLFLYPIGLFMQDLILEPFAIDNFGFGRENVGQIVAIWTSLTLVFVPLGVLLEKKSRKLVPIIGGEILSILGLLLFAVSAINGNLIVFYTGLVSFGVGNGLASAPAIGMMLDVCAVYPQSLTLLLGFFGIMTTIGRSAAAVLGGFILVQTQDNFFLLFVIEAGVVIISFIPLIILDHKMKQVDVETDIVYSINASAVDLS